MKRFLAFTSSFVLIIYLFQLSACKKIEELREDPEITPLKEGFKASAAIGYCASLAVMAFEGQDLPSNAYFDVGSNTEYSKSGIIYVNADGANPMPFNNHIEDIIIAGIWDETQESGVISIIFGDLDIFRGKYQFYGIHTVPVRRKLNGERFITAFAQQDVVVGQGSDTLINIGLSRVEFDQEIDRLNEDQPTDVFVAAQQNVWFIQFYQNDIASLADDDYEINGGGQIVSATDAEGGITYHAMIETKYKLDDCNLNPYHGSAFIQHIKAGEGIDLGNIFMDFHQECDGQANVTFATGDYVGANGRDIDLNFND